MFTGKWIKPGEPIDEALGVRRSVFACELGQPADAEPDALDAMSWQAVVLEGAQPIATGRIYWAEGAFCIDRVCVLAAMRGQGYGDLVMRLLLYKALDHGARSVLCEAPAAAAGFCARYGFAPVQGMPGAPDAALRMHATAEDLRLESACAKAAALNDAAPGSGG